VGRGERLLDALMRSKRAGARAATQLRRIAYAENIKRRTDDDRGLLEYWKKIQADFKVDPWVARAAARAFMQRGGHDTALDVLEAALNRDWHENWWRCTARSAAAVRRGRSNRPRMAARQAARRQLLLTLRNCAACSNYGQGAELSGSQSGHRAQRRSHIRMAELRTGTASR